MALVKRTLLPAEINGHPISDLFRDPRIAKAFRRAERDNGNAFAVPTAPKPVSPLGALVEELA